ncbi:hypothetical protein RYX36_019555 [Vicia faba]
MLLSNGEDQILLPSENETQVSNYDSVDGLLLVSKVYTDVAVVPEHQKNELQHFISSLQREVEELRLKQGIVDEKRRQALSKILDIKGSIRVFCRIRPNLLTEKRRNYEPVSAESERIRVKFGGTRKEFEFDKVFRQETTQDPKGLVEIEGLSEVQISDCAKARWWYNKGKRFRSTSWTNVNEASSRSHCFIYLA